ncbi:MAG TPA: response regulator [Thermoanaerobaculia bacterium]|jgi:CheY-like chemotaxis protein/DNA-directed RNA polymerase subunit RPC12/RpoP|nr:response regulator [Thermoanaerobaculia bacterium]
MDLTCKQCGARFRAAIPEPFTRAVRVACPSCSNQMVLKPAAAPMRVPAAPAAQPATLHDTPLPQQGRRIAVIADESRPFRAFLAEHLRRLRFDVTMFETGEPALDFIRRAHADLAIVNVYLKGRLGVEVTEDIRADASLAHTRIILIGALFRANRFRANPTNLYGADEYIEEQIPEREFRQIIRKLFPEVGHTEELPVEPKEYDEARRLARLILSDIVIYHPGKVELGIRDDNFFEVLKNEIAEGRTYYDTRVPLRVRQNTEIFSETLQQFVRMKREETGRLMTGTDQ